MLSDLPFDLFIFLLRVVFIFLLYFFLYQVVRVVSRELQAPPKSGARQAVVPAPSLTLVDDAGSDLVVGSVYPLQPVTTIGRGSDNVLTLPDAFVSTHHARLTQTNGRWYIVDLGSTNGTFVNDQRVERQPQRVKEDDILQIGRVKFRLSL